MLQTLKRMKGGVTHDPVLRRERVFPHAIAGFGDSELRLLREDTRAGQASGGAFHAPMDQFSAAVRAPRRRLDS